GGATLQGSFEAGDLSGPFHPVAVLEHHHLRPQTGHTPELFLGERAGGRHGWERRHRTYVRQRRAALEFRDLARPSGVRPESGPNRGRNPSPTTTRTQGSGRRMRRTEPWVRASEALERHSGEG